MGNYLIYKFTNPFTAEFYIGMTNDLSRRKQEHKNNKFRDTPDQWCVEVLHSHLTEEEAKIKEKETIETYCEIGGTCINKTYRVHSHEKPYIVAKEDGLYVIHKDDKVKITTKDFSIDYIHTIKRGFSSALIQINGKLIGYPYDLNYRNLPGILFTNKQFEWILYLYLLDKYLIKKSFLNDKKFVSLYDTKIDFNFINSHSELDSGRLWGEEFSIDCCEDWKYPVQLFPDEQYLSYDIGSLKIKIYKDESSELIENVNHKRQAPT